MFNKLRHKITQHELTYRKNKWTNQAKPNYHIRHPKYDLNKLFKELWKYPKTLTSKKKTLYRLISQRYKEYKSLTVGHFQRKQKKEKRNVRNQSKTNSKTSAMNIKHQCSLQWKEIWNRCQKDISFLLSSQIFTSPKWRIQGFERVEGVQVTIWSAVSIMLMEHTQMTR